MVKQLKHSSLYFSVSRFIVIESLGADCVDLVDEDNGGSFLFCHSKGISNHFRAISDVHLY